MGFAQTHGMLLKRKDGGGLDMQTRGKTLYRTQVGRNVSAPLVA